MPYARTGLELARTVFSKPECNQRTLQRAETISPQVIPCTAGRIKFHPINNLGKKQNTILITVFQAQDTLGRRLVDGAKTTRIYGKDILVRADTFTIGGLSAHADQAALLHWLRQFKRPPSQTFVVHGEVRAAQALADHIRKTQWNVRIPGQGNSVTL